MKNIALFFAFALFFACKTSSATVAEVDSKEAFTVAVNFFKSMDHEIILKPDAIGLSDRQGDKKLAYVFRSDGLGFIVVAADKRLDPVIFFSTTGQFGYEGPLVQILQADLSKRLANQHMVSETDSRKIADEWQRYSANMVERRMLEYWPPAGSTTTGGWTETAWNQNYPYNVYCPIHLATGQRTLVGCPATAIGQILHYHRDLNTTHFGTPDRYYHNFNQFFWIDDAWETYDFLSFETLNGYLDNIEDKMLEYVPLDNSDKAALSLAAAFASRTVFSPSVSGTFGVNQAFDAFQKFGFTESVLLNHSFSNDEIRQKMIENIQAANPVLLAVVDPNWQSGHNVVCDGYRDDDFFRLNMGWGGSLDGWYKLPEQFPYNLTVFEGIVADIFPRVTNPVTFVVLDEFEQPLENALVVIEETFDSIWTDESGLAIANLYNGTYNFSVSLNGFHMHMDHFTLIRKKLTIPVYPIPTSLSEHSARSITVFPNPAQHTVTIEGAEGATVLMHNLYGQLVAGPIPIASKTYDVSLSDLPAGMYVLTIIFDQGKVETFRLIKD